MSLGDGNTRHVAEALIGNQVKHIVYLLLIVIYPLFILNEDTENTADFNERDRRSRR
jgi:hypothetical protein